VNERDSYRRHNKDKKQALPSLAIAVISGDHGREIS